VVLPPTPEEREQWRTTVLENKQKKKSLEHYDLPNIPTKESCQTHLDISISPIIKDEQLSEIISTAINEANGYIKELHDIKIHVDNSTGAYFDSIDRYDLNNSQINSLIVKCLKEIDDSEYIISLQSKRWENISSMTSIQLDIISRLNKLREELQDISPYKLNIDIPINSTTLKDYVKPITVKKDTNKTEMYYIGSIDIKHKIPESEVKDIVQETISLTSDSNDWMIV